jgi:L-malate glycosyltransferase
VAPHKAQHDLIKALAVYRRLYDPRARLRIVGGPVGTTYPRALQRFASALGVTDAVEFAGSVTPEELVAYYRAADVFVCLSDHEGFCVPLIEAMAHQVPIVAYASTAVPDTVGAAGLTLTSKEPLRVAAAIHRVLIDTGLRHELAASSAARLESLSLGRSRTTMQCVIRTALQTESDAANAAHAETAGILKEGSG